ncbi:hypothetical protein F4859DRAFT_492994 [Xylaria cf. heliscus]|nr:hypothetical protein F4859DRAFT_492994 [Xylaria cf. heliscus]
MGKPMKPYIEKFPRRPKQPRDSTRQIHGHHGHYYHEHTEELVYDTHGHGCHVWHSEEYYIDHHNGEPSRSSRPMLINSASSYQPGDQLISGAYPGPVAPTPPNLPSLRTAEELAWTEDKHRLGERFDFPRPGYDSGEQMANTTALVPYGGPPHDWGQAQAALPAVPKPHHNVPRPVVVDMNSLAKWIGDHAVDYRKSGKAADLANRVGHNMGSFVSEFGSYRTLRKTARREQWGPQWSPEMEAFYNRALHIQALYESAVARYNGPFKRKKDCSTAEKAEAQQILETMFGADHDVWDGFIWHVLDWLGCYRRLRC